MCLDYCLAQFEQLALALQVIDYPLEFFKWISANFFNAFPPSHTCKPPLAVLVQSVFVRGCTPRRRQS
ncbi:hypothetical protein Pla144_25230 [Bythopirellula polymerisocia]|uniref:Uncharacterized protein n=1 Tax=Bythopirellula polymerisocia TaxID=2528003 RepID=A0A5C6CXI7_9BACT|nr:hypothetical protein Pla144_25230 [Bythopirellula polymerisocia]